MTARILTVFPLFLAVLSPDSGQPIHVDLAHFGYSAPPVKRSSFYWYPEWKTPPHLLSFVKEEMLIVGFVTREGASLATREKPAMRLHELVVNTRGDILDQRTFPTTDWYVNGIFAVVGQKVAIRTGTVFKLYSPETSIVAEREIPDLKTRIFVSPDHKRLVLDYKFPDPIEVLDAETLTPERPCPYPERVFLDSISNNSVSVRFPSPPGYPTLAHVEVHQICGPKRFGLEWDSNTGPQHPHGSVLLDDEHFVFASGPPWIEFFDRTVMKWRDSFDRKHDGIYQHVAVDKTGDRFAILVQRYVGGSNFFDIDGRLKSSKIVVYRSSDGSRLAEIPVQRIGQYDFEFTLSPEGTTLAILSDGDLIITRIGDVPGNQANTHQ